MSRLWSVVFWSVIAAAFIGPGTVTTAASAGAGYGYALVWALGFSTLACLVLQEASARLTVVTGRNLGQALRTQYGAGWSGAAVLVLVVGAVIFGCAAYEVGNILGGAAGALLGAKLNARAVALGTALVAGTLLGIGRTRIVIHGLGILVAVMGTTFLVTAWQLGPSLPALLSGALLPRVPSGSGLLILGLVGTTVVPYNLFLGSGLARGQTLPELRFGLTIAIILGGVISMGILVVGTAIDGVFGFDRLTAVLTLELGPWGRSVFGLGLFAAGLSSAITAPLAAAVTARSLFGGQTERSWGERTWRFRSVWIAVLAVGAAFGLADVRPIPAILVAQALNGVLLPFVAVFLLLAVNDRRLMGPGRVNGRWANGIMVPVVLVTVLLGVTGLTHAFATATGLTRPGGGWSVLVTGLVTAALARPIIRQFKAVRGPIHERAAGT